MADLNLTAGTSDMTAVTAPTAVAKPAAVSDTPQTLNKKIADSLRSRLENSVTNKRTFLTDWKRNVDTRLGQPVALYTEGLDVDSDLQSSINPDWSLTKTKTANLFSQVPPIRGTHVNLAYAAALAPFLKQLNYELGVKRANISVPMNECLNDVVNASGIAAAIVTYSARFDDVKLPVEDPLLPAPAPVAPMPQMGPDGTPLPAAVPAPIAPQTAPVARPVSDMISVTRISPKNLLWPSEFLGSDFNNGDFIGHRNSASRAVGQVDFKLTDEQMDKAVETAQSDGTTDLRAAPEKAVQPDLEQITYNELFYWRYRVDPKEKNFKAIWRIVFVDGITDPVIHEPWKGQRYDPTTRKYVGSCKFPIQVLTLTYITDNPVPPSDTQAGRPQVQDMRRSRSQMFQNRARSIPIRWFDVNRIDQDLQANLMRGIVQGMIPTNGSGDRAIGEIARASYPAENIEFDQAAQRDLENSWQIGPNQMSQSTGATASEAGIVQQNFTTRIGQERTFVANFMLNLADVVSGFLVLYSDFPVLTPEEKQAMMRAWDSKAILHDLVLNIVPDSTILLDAQARTKQLMGVLNMTAQSGFVNPEPIIAEILELNGLDPTKVMVKPEGKKDTPKVSFTFNGKDDMQNPIALAIYMANGAPLTPEMIEQAKQILDNLALPAMPAAPGPAGPPQPPNGQQPPAHPGWEQVPKIATRSREIGGA